MGIKTIVKSMVYRLRGEYTVEQLKKMGLKVGENFNPQLGFELDPSHCWLIEIGNNVTFGPHVQVLAHDASTCMHIGYARIGRVTIGDNVFIGAGSVVLPGVTIGSNSVIGAGSVVSKSVPNGVVAVGNPAKPIQKIEVFQEKHEKAMKICPVYGEEYTLRGKITGDMKQRQCLELEESCGYIR